MKLPKLPKNRMIEEIRDLGQDLAQRISEIEAHPQSALQYSVQRFNKNIKPLNLDYNKLDDIDYDKLERIHRELRAIDYMKTSTLEGAELAKQKWAPILDKLESFGKEEVKSVNEIMNKLYSMNYQFWVYRYEIEDVVTEKVESGYTSEQIIRTINTLYKNTMLKLGDFAKDKEVYDLFYSKLKSYRYRGKK